LQRITLVTFSARDSRTAAACARLSDGLETSYLVKPKFHYADFATIATDYRIALQSVPIAPVPQLFAFRRRLVGVL